MRFGRVAGVRLSGVMRNESRALSTICPQRSNLKSIRWGQIADHTCSQTRPTSAIRPQPPAARSARTRSSHSKNLTQNAISNGIASSGELLNSMVRGIKNTGWQDARGTRRGSAGDVLLLLGPPGDSGALDLARW